jgi:hypothetical protein
MILKANKTYEISYKITPTKHTKCTIALPNQEVLISELLVTEAVNINDGVTVDFQNDCELFGVSVKVYEDPKITLQQHNVYRCRVKLRDKYMGCRVKENFNIWENWTVGV